MVPWELAAWELGVVLLTSHVMRGDYNLEKR